MKITVEQLLAQIQTPEMNCIAGFKGLNRPISSFTIIDTPEIVEWLNGGEFVVSLGYVSHNNPQMRKTLIQDLVAKGCAGLGIKKSAYYQEVPEEYIELGNLYDFPVIIMPYDMRFSDLAYLIHKNLFEHNLSVTEVSYDIFLKLMKLIVANSSIEHMLTDISLALDNPLVLLSKDFEVMGYELLDKNIKPLSMPEFGQQVLQYVKSIKGEVEEYFIGTQFNSFTSLMALLGKEIKVTTIAIKSDNEILGYLVVVETGTKLSVDNQLILETILSALSLYFLKNQLVPIAMGNQNTFLKRVLHDSNNNKETIRQHCKVFGFDYSNLRVCINITLSEVHLWSYKVKKTARSLIDISLKNICSELKLQRFSLWEGDHLIVFFHFSSSLSNREIGLMISEISEKILKDLNELDLQVHIGVSSIGEDLTHIQQAYIEAMEIIPIGQKVNPEKFIHEFEKLKIYYMLKTTLSKEELNSLAETLTPLIEIDKESGSEYVSTLENVIKNNLNLSKTAKEMYIHRNSLIYRVNKIKEILNADIEDSDEKLKIQLALHALRVREL